MTVNQQHCLGSGIFDMTPSVHRTITFMLAGPDGQGISFKQFEASYRGGDRIGTGLRGTYGILHGISDTGTTYPLMQGRLRFDDLVVESTNNIFKTGLHPYACGVLDGLIYLGGLTKGNDKFFIGHKTTLIWEVI